MDSSLGVCSHAGRARTVDQQLGPALCAKPPRGRGHLSDKVPQILGCDFQFTDLSAVAELFSRHVIDLEDDSPCVTLEKNNRILCSRVIPGFYVPHKSAPKRRNS